MTEPQSVEIVLDEQEIPQERIDCWKEEWDELDMLDRPSRSEYLEQKAIEWTREVFLNAQGHHDVHLWIDDYTVNYD